MASLDNQSLNDELNIENPPGIDVIVPVYNKRQFLESSLNSIFTAAEAATLVRVTVLDHGSTDGSSELGAALCRGRARHLIRHGGTIAALRNAGAVGSDREVLSFLDADCVIPRDYFVALRQVFSRPEIASAGCRVDYPTNGPWIERVWNELHRSSHADGFRHYLNAGNFAVRRSVFHQIGGFDERLVTGEDAEIGMRLNRAGFSVFESRSLSVLHLDNPRSAHAFVRKEIWHAQGMFGTFSLWPLDLPTAMTFAFLVSLLAAALLLLTGAMEGLLLRAIVACLLVFSVPICAVGYRALSKRRCVPWLQGVALYELYFLARSTALIQLALGQVKAHLNPMGPRRRSE